MVERSLETILKDFDRNEFLKERASQRLEEFHAEEQDPKFLDDWEFTGKVIVIQKRLKEVLERREVTRLTLLAEINSKTATTQSLVLETQPSIQRNSRDEKPASRAKPKPRQLIVKPGPAIRDKRLSQRENYPAGLNSDDETPIPDKLNLEADGLEVASLVFRTKDNSDQTVLETYFHEISQFPLLTTEEGVELSKQREAGARAKQILAAENDDPIEIAKLYDQVQIGEAAYKRLIESNLRLVVSVARKYMGRGVPLSDLIQEGNTGLMRGIELYDWRQGFKISTFTYWHIRQRITRAIMDQSRTIRIPVNVYGFLGEVNKAQNQIAEGQAGRLLWKKQLRRWV